MYGQQTEGSLVMDGRSLVMDGRSLGTIGNNSLERDSVIGLLDDAFVFFSDVCCSLNTVAPCDGDKVVSTLVVVNRIASS